MALTVFLVACAVSLDSFIAGVSYGLKRVKLPLLSRTVIASESGALVTGAILLGHALSFALTPWVAKLTGAFLLIALGFYAILRDCKSSSVIKMLVEPLTADRDCSGEISTAEAAVLGVALGIDSFAMGLGLALAGMGTLATGLACTIGCLFSMLGGELVGASVGASMGDKISTSLSSTLPGLVMIILGVSKIF